MGGSGVGMGGGGLGVGGSRVRVGGPGLGWGVLHTNDMRDSIRLSPLRRAQPKKRADISVVAVLVHVITLCVAPVAF